MIIGDIKDENNLLVTSLSIKCANDTNITIDNLETVVNFYNKFDMLYDKIINRNNISAYNKHTLSIENYYINTAICGFFGHQLPKDILYCALDQNKCYTFCASLIKQIGIFNHFDIYKKYDGHEIKPSNKYIVKCYTDDNISAMIFRNTTNKLYDFLLKALPVHIQYQIIYYIEPSHIVDINFEKNISDLYE